MKTYYRFRFSIRVVMLLMLIGLSSHGMAESAQQDASEQRTEPQPTTKAWLELQSSGAAASEQSQTLSGPAMDRVHERYLKNFTHPIPPSYEHVERINY